MGSVELFGMNKYILVLVFGLLFFGFASAASVDESQKIRVMVRATGAPSRSMSTGMRSANNDFVIKNDLGDRMSVEVFSRDVGRLKNYGFELIGEDALTRAFLQDAGGIVGADEAWGLNFSRIGLDGSGTAVCVIDSGVDSTHPDLSGKVIAEHCFCSANEGGNANCCPDGTGEDNNATDNNGHGTHIAGIIASSGGLDGIARGTNIVAVKVLNSSGIGFTSDVKRGIEWCANDAQINAHNISVISLSLGNGQYSNTVDCLNEDYTDRASAINLAYSKNISVVVSTGNTDAHYTNASAGISSPACLGNTTKVTASTKADMYANYAFRNINFPDILIAPGSLINSTYIGSGYQIYSGTSMSSPMVSGAIAIINQYIKLGGRTKTPSEIAYTLNNTGVALDDSDVSGYNFSRIDIYSALLSLDVDVPNVTLTSPADEKVNLTVNQTFVCNATDWQLANVTLQVWNSSGLYYNVSESIGGIENESIFELTDMALGSYSWNCLAYDLLENSGSAASNFSLVIGGVSTNLTSPPDSYYTNGETNFSCDGSSEETAALANMTFYLWNSSGLYYNASEDVSGTSNSSTFNYSFSEEGNYTWNCLAVNNNSNSSWGDSNYTFVYDVTTPNISLVSSSVTSSGATINWITNESANSSVEGSASGSSTDYVTNHSISLTGLSASTAYSYNVTSCDRAGNCNSSDGHSFTTSAPASPPSNNPGGGGTTGTSSSTSSAGTSTPSVYVAELASSPNGYTRILKKNEKINFSIFDLAGERHSLAIDEIGEDYVNLTIASDPASLRLGVGQSSRLNLSSADYYDLLVALNSISEDGAELTIQLINEPIEKVAEKIVEGETIETEVFVIKDYFWVVVVLVVVLVAIIYIAVKRGRSKELKGSKSKKKHGRKSKKVEA